jgi:SAM-dependent MidA family methyltransferase
MAGAIARRFGRIVDQAREGGGPSSGSHPSPDELIIREFGAGNGALAADLLTLLDARGCLPTAYQIIEPSPAMRTLQQDHVAQLPTDLFARICWLDPSAAQREPVRGLILANEVADAFPVKVFAWQAEPPHVWEWGVTVGRPGPPGTDAGNAEGSWLRWTARPAQDPLRRIVTARQAEQQAMGQGWVSGHRGEWAPDLGPWAQGLSASLAFGELLLIDYGYEQYELDHPDRGGGTLAGHWRHRRIDDWQSLLARPGAQDLTAHVNFTELAEAMRPSGVELALQTQAAWLLDQGVLEDAADRLFGAGPRGAPPEGLSALVALSNLQTLLSDGAMGQSFLVLSASRGL